MHYHIARQSPASQFIQVQLTLDCRAGETIHLQLAAWRPGRYELANYAQKIRSFKVHHKELPLKWQKKSKDLWYFSAQETGTYQVTYEYYCNQMDAGGCWSDDIQLYLNFSNFIFDVKERSNEAISLSIALPENYQVATALPNKGHGRWEASGYQHLMDSPLLAAVELQHFDYQVAGHQFHLWFHGEIHFDIAQLIKDFKAFTKKQIEAFGTLPAEHYHFIFQLLPYKHYHGVEHAYSTVITYGPASALAQKSELDELVGVSSHELYHFWNVCRIRPKELIPYDLSNEVYLDTGLILEGVTTYMGDHFLLESGYFSLEDYLKILQKQIQKEVDHQGWENQNILESSFDLWLDGYKPGIPDKKVNIYNRGALIALCLDLMLKSGESSLSQVMKKMWESFGSTGQGYVLDDFYSMLCQSTENSQPIKAFWEDYVLGKGELILPLTKLLANIGVRLTFHDEGDTILHAYGIRKDENGKVLQVHPEADAYSKVMINDLLSYDSGMSKSDKADDLEIVLERQGRKLETIIYKGNKSLYPKVKLEILQKKFFAIDWIKNY